jgi:hypothetical protein
MEKMVIALFRDFTALPLNSVKECDNILTELIYFEDHPEMQSKVNDFRK